MPEMKNNFQTGKMNKDLDERLVPNGEYRDALNVEIAMSNDSDMGTLQTLKGNTLLSKLDPNGQENFICIGSIADNKNDKLYFMVSGSTRDMIIEYDYTGGDVSPVCIDNYLANGHRALNFNEEFLITGINIVDDLLFWTDNNSEPKRINITRGKLGSIDTNFTIPTYVHTKLMVRDLSSSAQPNSYTPALDKNGDPVLIHEKDLTVIRKGPPTAPVLEMIDTLVGDWDGDGEVGGDELSRVVSNASTLNWLDSNGDFISPIHIELADDPDGDMGPPGYPQGVDFPPGCYLNVYKADDRSVKVRIKSIGAGGPIGFDCDILSGNKEIQGETDLVVELEQEDTLFQFKFPRFAYRYKYEDGEYSPFSPFTEPAFLPGRFNYLPKEGYNLGMVNRLRRLAIKDFVHERSIGDDVVSIDILYKESNSPNIYSVKTVKRVAWQNSVWDSWNANSPVTVAPNWSAQQEVDTGWRGVTKGYLPITTEMIHATLPSNQLLRPWDNVPRKALAQEVIGNRLVYGNYLQNYDLKNLGTNNSYIKVNIHAKYEPRTIGNV